MHRFVVNASILAQAPVVLDGAVAHQISRVLRLMPGQRVVLLCGDGCEHEAELMAMERERVQLAVLTTRQPQVELTRRVELGVALLKGEKLEWVVQKTTELGAAAIHLLRTQHAVVQADDERRWANRLERYRSVAREAVEQCGRVRFPAVEGPLALTDYVGTPCPGLTIFGDPGAERSFRDLLRDGPEGVRILVGPEGGFSEEEREVALAAGAVPCSFGPRVLRSETAAIVAVGLAAALME